MDRINFREDFIRDQLAQQKLNEALEQATEEKMAIMAFNEMVEVDAALSAHRRDSGNVGQVLGGPQESARGEHDTTPMTQ